VTLALMLRGLGTSYLQGAFMGYNMVNGSARANNINIGDFRNLQVQMASNLAASLEINDLKDLEKQLRDIAPALYHKFRRDQKKLGEPARDAVRQTFRSVNSQGPLGAPKRPGRVFDKMATSELGRLSWYSSKIMSANRTIDVNYKNRKAKSEFAKVSNGRDGTLSIVRVRILAPAYVVADMAGKSGTATKPTGTLSREYSINLFGRGIVTRRHRIDDTNVENWLRRLNNQASNRGQDTPSRYGWPTMEKHAPKYRADASKLLNETIAILNQRMQ
jgi:hypothetical protein